MDNKEIKKKLDSGGVLAQISFEIIGNPKEHIETGIKGFMEKIAQAREVHIISQEIGEAEELEGGLWSIYSDTEILFERLEKLVWVCINFMPGSVEIIAPEELKFKEKDLTNWLNDLLAKLHEMTLNVRQNQQIAEGIAKSMNSLVHNAIMLAVETYHTKEDIVKKIGIPEEQIQQFLDILVKKGKLEKRGEKYLKKKGK